LGVSCRHAPLWLSERICFGVRIGHVYLSWLSTCLCSYICPLKHAIDCCNGNSSSSIIPFLCSAPLGTSAPQPLRFNCLFIAARRPFDSVDPAPLLAPLGPLNPLCVCVICGCCSLLMHYMNFNKLCILTDYPPFCPFSVCLL